MNTKPIRLDCTNVLDEVIGPTHGLSSMEMEEWIPRVDDALASLLESPPGFLGLPHRTDLLAQVRQLEPVLEGMQTLVVLGIGGSALGPRALFEAAFGPYGNLRVGKPGGPARTLHVADNIDPEGFGQILDAVDPSTTLFNVVSKSGSTVETMSQLTIAWRRMTESFSRDEAARHFVFTTDPQKGYLRATATRLGIPAVDIPEDVGGRFSVLTPVGLFPAMATGIDPEVLLQGAIDMEGRCRDRRVEHNPAAVLALIHFLLDRLRGKTISVMMPYSDRLRTFAEWFGQLWAESLGKSHTPDGEERSPVGQTPVRALGTTDQHSQVQLYVEGPNDKLMTLLAVEQVRNDLELGAADLTSPPSALAYLDGHTLGGVFQIEQIATEMALARASRPTLVWRIEQVGPHALGQLFQVYETACALAGMLYNINPYDQPGVEEGKNLTYGALGREGYEVKAQEMTRYRNRADSWIIGGTGSEEDGLE